MNQKLRDDLMGKLKEVNDKIKQIKEEIDTNNAFIANVEE
jgi:hypothetical protein